MEIAEGSWLIIQALLNQILHLLNFTTELFFLLRQCLCVCVRGRVNARVVKQRKCKQKQCNVRVRVCVSVFVVPALSRGGVPLFLPNRRLPLAAPSQCSQPARARNQPTNLTDNRSETVSSPHQRPAYDHD
jgi:hypothetical protein